MSNANKTDRPLLVGMIGVGGFGGYRRARMRETGLFRLAVCYDRNAEVLAKVCAAENAQAAQSVDQLLATPGLEGLVISTGVDSHAELSIRGMEAGLHVFVEKPLCGRIEEVRALLACQARTGKVVGLGHSDHETSWIYRLIRQHLDSGQLGVLAAYEENSSHSGGLEIKPGDWRGMRERNAGGMLMQCGVHALHLLIHLFGPIAELQAMMRYDANPNTQTADAASVLLRHESGLVGTLNCYHVSAYLHEMRLFGSKGNLYIDTFGKQAFFQPRKRGDVEERTPVTLPAADPRDILANMDNWYRAIRQGGPAQPSLEDGIAALLPVFAAERSDEEGRRVALREMLDQVAVAR